MNKPVAWRKRHSGDKYWRYEETGYIGDWDDVERLYTAEQLNKRVKMTKNQHKQFENYKKGKNSFYHFWQSLIVDDISLRKEFSERELMLVWLDEKTIEIVPDMKWFIETKNMTSDYRFLKIDFENKSVYNKSLKIYASSFETKSQAESWVTPLTKAVQLPVGDE